MAEEIRKKREKLEIKLMAECYLWFNNNCHKHRGLFRRVKNELDDYPVKTKIQLYQQLNENKLTGIVPGTWDAFFMARRIVWFEFKVGNNGLSEDQKEFMRIGLQYGWIFYITTSLEEFKLQIYEISE
jgi:hypothetical protein